MLTCLFLRGAGEGRRLSGNSEVEVGTEEQCFQRGLTILGACMRSFFTNNYLQLLPRGQTFVKLYQYINTQTHAHIQEHFFINHNESGSVLSDKSHEKVSLMPSFFFPFSRLQIHAT